MDIQTIEGYILRAWHALDEESCDGWLLRFANGYTSRSNSVNPLYGSTLDVNTKIDYCESAYQQRGLIPRFKLTPAAYPADLDSVLEERGYTRQTPSQVMTLDLAQLPPFENKPDVHISGDMHLSQTWLNAYVRLSEIRAEYLDTMQTLLQHNQPQPYFACARQGDEIVAVTLGVWDEDMIGLFDVVTQSAQRGQGIGTALITHVLQQGIANGARTGYLQVLGANTSAIRLYTRLGFQFAYPYWYRTLSDRP